jgi:putative glutamine amidotransferase
VEGSVPSDPLPGFLTAAGRREKGAGMTAPDGHEPPLIGLTTYVEPARCGSWEEVSAILPISYVTSVIRSGGCPVLLPPSSAGPDVPLSALHGLVVTGGPDVDPELYGAQPHAETGVPRRERDSWEIALCRAALDDDLPMLAICRGVQLLNIAMGGTLHQHLPDVIGNTLHRGDNGQMNSNEMTLLEDSAVASIVGTRTEGLCHHHQAIDRLGRRIRAVGFAPDGTVEAVEVAGQEFAVGVQWHPEDNPEDDRLFRALVEAAAAFRNRPKAES